VTKQMEDGQMGHAACMWSPWFYSLFIRRI